jgi:outer membrane protein TolC
MKARRVALGLLLGAGLALRAAAAPGPLPEETRVRQVLAASPALAAAAQGVEAGHAGRRQLQAGPNEWVLESSLTRHRYGVDGPQREWDIGLARGWRSPGKAQAAAHLGEARLEAAQGGWRLVWREQARALLERHVAWLQAREAAAVWQAQVALLQRQAEAVQRRRRLGDAAPLEQLQADAALAQAQAQQSQAQGRAEALRQALAQQFPGLEPAPDAPLPPPEGPRGADVAALLQSSPELEGARQEALVARAQARLDAAERRADPVLGARVGAGPAAGERIVGVSLSLPLGGAYREAGAQAAAARALAAEARQGELQRRLEAEAGLKLRERELAWAGWQRQEEAARQLERSAQGFSRGYALGEGSLAEVLAARRVANEQRLAAALAAVEAWAAAWRVELEAGRLWAPEGL